MRYYQYVPKPPLSAFIELFWLYEGFVPNHAKERVLPTGTMELVINLRDDHFRIFDRSRHDHFQSFCGALVCGTFSEFFVIDTAQQVSIMGVHFKSGGAFPFFKLPAIELRDVHVSLETLWGTFANELRAELLETPTAKAKFCRLEQALLKQAAKPLAHHPAVSFALKELPRTRTIGDVTGQIGLSQKQLYPAF